jgi:hypothetical protein
MPRYKFQAGDNAIPEVPSMNTPTVIADYYKSELETGFPRVMQAIEALWGYKELNDYFRKLMINNDSGTRAGFPKEAWEEIDMLHHIHQELFPDWKQ